MAKIIWSDSAIQELEAIAEYIALDKPEAARRMVQKVVTAVGRLGKSPHRGPRVPELLDLPYRQLVVPPCRIFYRPEKTIVYIVHILRGEQLVRRELFPPE